MQLNAKFLQLPWTQNSTSSVKNSWISAVIQISTKLNVFFFVDFPAINKISQELIELSAKFVLKKIPIPQW